MYVSKTDFNIRSDKYDEMVEFGNSIIPELRQIPGIKQFAVLRTGETSASSLATYESQAAAEAAGPQIQQLFAKMADFVTAPPERNIHEAIIFEQF